MAPLGAGVEADEETEGPVADDSDTSVAAPILSGGGVEVFASEPSIVM